MGRGESAADLDEIEAIESKRFMATPEGQALMSDDDGADDQQS